MFFDYGHSVSRHRLTAGGPHFSAKILLANGLEMSYLPFDHGGSKEIAKQAVFGKGGCQKWAVP